MRTTSPQYSNGSNHVTQSRVSSAVASPDSSFSPRRITATSKTFSLEMPSTSTGVGTTPPAKRRLVLGAEGCCENDSLSVVAGGKEHDNTEAESLHTPSQYSRVRWPSEPQNVMSRHGQGGGGMRDAEEQLRGKVLEVQAQRMWLQANLQAIPLFCPQTYADRYLYIGTHTHPHTHT